MNLKKYITNLFRFPSIFNLWIPHLVSILGFCPHRPSYIVRVNQKRQSNGEITEEFTIELNETGKYLLLSNKYYKYSDILETHQKEGLITSFFTNTSRGNRIFCLKFSPKKNSEESKIWDNRKIRYTIVYSHPNGCDLGLTIGSLWRLAKKCECDVVTYDYSGYGMSTGRPSERNICADIEAVFRTLINEHNVKENMIIFYGESIGSVATIHMAGKTFPAGVILHAAFMSGIRTFYNYNRPTWTFDPFPNIERIDQICAPVIHGLRDNVVDVSHGVSLYERCRYKVSPLWLRTANHSDVRICPPFFPRIQYFLKECQRFEYVGL